MARIRTVKPEMAQDEDLASVSIEAQLLAIRILNHSDDEGYFKANPALIKANCFPLVDSVNIPGMLRELSEIGYLRLCASSTDGKQYGQVCKFTEHQRVNKPTPSKIKGLAQFTEAYRNAPVVLPAGKERKGKERKGNSVRTATRFDEWWDAFANKKNRKGALKIWKQRNLDTIADDLIADAQKRHREDGQWLRGFQPHPTTYLNGDRWEDELEPARKTNGTMNDAELVDKARRLGIDTAGLTRDQIFSRIEGMR